MSSDSEPVPVQSVCVDAAADAVLTLRVTPRSSRTEVNGVIDGALRVHVAAPPVNGAANEALLKFLAKRLRVPRCRITVASGESSRLKRVRVAGLSCAEIYPLLGEHG